MNTWANPVAVRLMFSACLFFAANAVFSQTQTETWTGAGNGIAYSDPANWTPLLALPPVNTGPVGFIVDIPYVAAHSLVRFDQALGNAQINQLSLADNMTLRLQDTANTGTPNVTGLTVLNSATINGIVDADNANFTAPATVTLGNRARFYAANSAVVTVPATSYSSVGLLSEYMLMSADGAGSQLNLSSVTTIDAGFNVNTWARTHTIQASNGGLINLSSVQSILGPIGSEAADDRLLINVESGGSINLGALTSINGQTGRVDISLSGMGSTLSMGATQTLQKTNLSVSGAGNSIVLPVVQSLTNVTFAADAGGAIHAAGAPVAYSSTGLAGNYTLMSADGSGSQLNLPALSSINAGFNANTWARTQTIQAGGGGQINLSGVQSILGPSGSEARDDRLWVSVSTGGSINLSGLKSVSGQDGQVDFTVSSPGTILSLPAIESLSKVTLTAASGGTLQALNSAATFSSVGLSGNYALMSADGVGSQLNLPAITSINAGFNVNTWARTHSITASNGGSIKLSGVQSILGPSGSEAGDDRLLINVESGGSVNLGGLTSVNGQTGWVDFSLSGSGSNLSMASAQTLQKTTISASGSGNAISLPAVQSLTNSTLAASAGGIVHIAGATPVPYSSTGLAGEFTLLSADGTGSVLNLPALSGINAGFNVNTWARSHAITASNGGAINLVGVQSILGPSGGEAGDDRLLISAQSGGSINLNGLTSINGQTGRVDIDVSGASSNISLGAAQTLQKTNITVSGAGNSVSLPAVQSLTNSTLAASAGASIQIAGAPAPFSSTGLAGNFTLMSADGTGSFLNLPALSEINAGFNVNTWARSHTIQALNSGQINLSGVQSILGPTGGQAGDDRLVVSVQSGGSINLSGLTSVNAQSGHMDFSASGYGSNLDMGKLQTLAGGAGKITFALADGGHIRVGQLTNPAPISQIVFTGAPSILTVDRDLNLGAIPVTVEQSATLNVGGNFSFGHTNETHFQLAHSTVRAAGPGIQSLEIGGLDVGLATGFLANDNFALGALVLDQQTEARGVQLTDHFNNGNTGGFGGASEALYLFGQGAADGLQILSHTTLTIGKYHLYAQINSVLTDISAMFGPNPQRIPFGNGYIQNVLFGDFNYDGLINALDISPFVTALVNPAAYHAAYSTMDLVLVEPSGDGLLNAIDISWFVSLIVSGGVGALNSASGGMAVVPEPASLSLVMALALAASRRRRR